MSAPIKNAPQPNRANDTEKQAADKLSDAKKYRILQAERLIADWRARGRIK